jgi:hypothetical protein
MFQLRLDGLPDESDTCVTDVLGYGSVVAALENSR